MTRFIVQLEPVPPALRIAALAPPLPGGHAERVEILFANLRKAMLTNNVKVLHNAGTSGAEFDHDFKFAWLQASGFDPAGTQINVSPADECPCNTCLYGYASSILGTAYHVHWQVDDSHHSVAVFGCNKDRPFEWILLRGRYLPNILETVDDYVLAMGWVIDDVLHACAQEPIIDERMIETIEADIQRLLRRRTAAHVDHVIKAEWIERTRRVECRVTLSAVYDGLPKTIVAGRQLR